MTERTSGDPPDVHDLFALDRDVERAVRGWRAWRSALRSDPDLHADEDVFLVSAHRRVATKSLFGALGALTKRAGVASLHEEALRRWVAFLLQARLTREADVTIAREMTSREAVLEDVRRVSYREAWRGVVMETARGKSIAWFDAAASRGPSLAALRRERRRLGLDGELVPPALTHQEALASALLDATEDLSGALLREEQKREGVTAPHPVDAIRLAMARDAREGWPARLSARWLHELFHSWFTGASRFELDPLPSALAGASFVRALESFGQSFRRASFEAKSTLPFALRQDPHFVDVYRTGALTASLSASPVFHRRALGLGKDAAVFQARTLGKTLLFALRFSSVRLLLGGAGADGSTWDELTARLFGLPAPRALAFAWPECRDDEGARLVGTLTALPLLRSLVDRHDEDWFSNPRAIEALRTRTLYPAREPPEETLEPSQSSRIASEMGRNFEELFG